MAKRLKNLPPPTQRTLIVLAGFPLSTAAGVASWLSDRLPNSPRIVFVTSPERDGCLYKTSYVDQCLRAATDYAERVSNFAPPSPAPNGLILAYIPDQSAIGLLEAFAFSAFPVALTGLDEYTSGRQARHDLRQSRDIALNALNASTESVGLVKRRLNTYSPKDPLYLPPHNFQLEAGVYLTDLFTELRDGLREWNEIVEVRVIRASHDDLQVHAGDHGINVGIDARDLLFPRDLSGHARARELDENESDGKHRESLLKTLYRFGIPLPNGFHHDVQFAGKNLNDTEFHCTVKGSFPIDSAYANVYPDDFVRPSK